MSIRAIVIGADGGNETVEIGGNWRALSKYVGGYIEAVHSTDARITLWCNEEGKLQHLPANVVATFLWWSLNESAQWHDVLCGDVVVTGGTGSDGETLGLDDEQHAVITRWLGAGQEIGWLSNNNLIGETK